MNPADATALIENGPNLARCAAMGTDALVAHLRDAATIDRMWRCLQPLLDSPEEFNRRIFLSAYMIACDSATVFQDQPQPELVALARAMLEQLEDIAYGVADNQNNDQAAGGVSNQTLETFKRSAHDFYARFNEWQTADRVRLVARIEGVFFMLIQAKAAVPTATDPLHAQIDAQIARLLAKHRSIGADPARTEALEASIAVFGGGGVPPPA